jgi:ribonuclease E
MKKEMLINVLQPEECRIAIVEDGQLEELYVERASQESYVGNIYKGRIVNIEPSIQAAFVDFGIGRNGFLHVSDVDPAYYKHLLSKEDLAEYEAELDREYGVSSRPRGSGRGGRGRSERVAAVQPMTSWLEPQTPPPPAETDEDETSDFAAGIDDQPLDTPAADDATPVAEEVIEAAEIVHPTVPSPTAELASDDDFAAGIEPEPPGPATATVPSAPRAPAASRSARVVAPPADDDEFGAGILEPEATTTTAAPATNAEAPPTPAPTHSPGDWLSTAPPAEAATPVIAATPDEAATPVAEPLETGEPLEAAEAEAEPKVKKVRTRKTKPKTDDADTDSAEPSAESKSKPRRRPRKKAEGETDDTSPDEKPRYMGGAERRTTADDDEPEITPFFEESSGFDPDAPNDRFTQVPDESEGEGSESAEGLAADAEPNGDNGWDTSEATADATGDWTTPASGEEEAANEEAEAVGVGRGFNDAFEDTGPPRRDRGRSRGRDRDRGERGSRERDRGDRGGRPGTGFRNGAKNGRDRGLPKPPIQEIFKRGQEVLVQVIKEGIGTKGPTLSTYISIAGRYLVLMPSLNRVGVSRKIEDHEARRRLREIMATLSPPKGVGFIVRTAAIDRDAKELRNDLVYLLRLWQVVVKRIKRVSGPVEIYRESDMITRTIRDIFTNDIDTIWVDEPNAFAHASEFLQIVMPKFASRIRYFESTEPLFHKYGVEEEIAKIHQKRIEMPLGGSLVIEQTEALVAIDVNSGNFRADNNAEETAFQMNLHAAKEIARQLRLRDLGGVIVNDFIDMRSEVHRRKVEEALREALKRDRARTKILRISQFGLIEMTRQRIRPSLKRSIFADCPHCRGTGFVKTSESLSIDVMRLLQLAAHRAPAIATVQVSVHSDVAHYLLNKRRKDLAAMEERAKLEIQVTGQVGVSPDTLTIRCFDHNGNEVRLLPPAPIPRLSGGRYGGNRGERDRERRYPQPLD